MKSILWSIILNSVLIFSLVSSIRLGLEGHVNFPACKILKFIAAKEWCYSLFLFLPWHVGAFARGETSPIPWVAFRQECWRHGFYSALLAAGIVLLVDLWLFWVPANIWINRNKEIDKKHRMVARLINLIGGLLLVTLDNPIYKFLNTF
jgi:hypothetical protein